MSKIKSKEIESIDMVEENLFPEQIELPFSESVQGNDRFIDTMFAWGDEEAIAERIRAHLDAGASHVCIQPINPNGNIGEPDWAVLESMSELQID